VGRTGVQFGYETRRKRCSYMYRHSCIANWEVMIYLTTILWVITTKLYIGLHKSRSRSYFTTDSQSVCLGIEYPCGTCDQILFPVGMLLPEICGLVSVGCPLSREDGFAICSVITQWFESLRTRNHILLSHLKLPQPGGPGSHIYIPQEQGGPVIPPGTGFRGVKENAVIETAHNNSCVITIVDYHGNSVYRVVASIPVWVTVISLTIWQPVGGSHGRLPRFSLEVTTCMSPQLEYLK
jgi:hypothetical protein